MSLPVHLVPSLADVAEGSVVTVEGAEAHHAVTVRRLRVGESVVLTDGVGTSAQGTVSSTGRRVFEVTVSAFSSAPGPSPSVVVVQALPKGDRGELAVEVLTEVGVSSIVPWAAARSVATWRGERAAKSLARWPEGGLTDEEVAAFADAGAHPVRLGAEVLRTSTAGVAAVSALLSRTPRWG